MEGTPFQPTHTVPDGGLDAWAAPDPAEATVARLDQWLDVEVREERGAWAHVVCANGWSAWVDGRRLVPRGAPRPAVAPAAASPMVARASTVATTGAATPAAAAGRGAFAFSPAVAGGAGAALGAFLPWLRGGFSSINALDVPLWFLVDYKGADGGLGVGPVVLVLAAVGGVLAGLPGRALPARVCGALLALVAVLHVVQLRRLFDAAGGGDLLDTVGMGVWITLAGGLVLALAPAARRR